MRTLVLLGVAVLAVVVGGCRRRVPEVRVIIPNTPEGLACERQCLQIFHSCQGGRGQNARICRGEYDGCLETCPGAMFSDGRRARGSMTQPNGTSAIEPPMVTAPAPQPAPLADGGTKCVASENPEWATASAAKKKELLDACR